MSSSISNNNTSSIPTWDSPNWEIVKEWNLGEEKIVRFLRSGDRFWTLSKIGTNIPVGEPFELSEGVEPISPEETIAQVSMCQPYINDTGTVDFLRKFKSKLNDVTLTEREWGVTLVDLGRSMFDIPPLDENYLDASLNSPLSWCGHTVIIIETIEDGESHMWRGELLKTGNLAAVCFRRTNFDALHRRRDGTLRENISRTETWVRTKFLVKKMMNQLDLEAARSTKRKPIGFINGQPISFSFDGGYSFNSPYRNCTSWARERMFLADIYIPFHISHNVLQIPVRYINPSIPTIVINEVVGFAAPKIITKVIVAIPLMMVPAGPIAFVCAGVLEGIGGALALGHSFNRWLTDKNDLIKFRETIDNPILSDRIEMFLKKYENYLPANILGNIQAKVDSLKEILKSGGLQEICSIHEELAECMEREVRMAVVALSRSRRAIGIEERGFMVERVGIAMACRDVAEACSRAIP